MYKQRPEQEKEQPATLTQQYHPLTWMLRTRPPEWRAQGAPFAWPLKTHHMSTHGTENSNIHKTDFAHICVHLQTVKNLKQQPTSINRCFKSSKMVSDWFLLMNVVARPVFPQRPVRPALCDIEFKDPVRPTVYSHSGTKS